MKTIVHFFLLTVLIMPLSVYASGEDEIHGIIEAFGQAIKEKDKPAFMSLFVADGVSWIGVFSDKEFSKFSGQEGMPGKLYKSSPSDFIEWIISADGATRETFENVVVNTDGEVAAVYFDYKFYLDNNVHNWGAESWLLVNTESGWKIQAVNFSYSSNN